jgi:hypothetical protein
MDLVHDTDLSWQMLHEVSDPAHEQVVQLARQYSMVAEKDFPQQQQEHYHQLKPQELFLIES